MGRASLPYHYDRLKWSFSHTFKENHGYTLSYSAFLAQVRNAHPGIDPDCRLNGLIEWIKEPRCPDEVPCPCPPDKVATEIAEEMVEPPAAPNVPQTTIPVDPTTDSRDPRDYLFVVKTSQNAVGVSAVAVEESGVCGIASGRTSTHVGTVYGSYGWNNQIGAALVDHEQQGKLGGPRFAAGGGYGVTVLNAEAAAGGLLPST
jgi:hypothetical protein